MEIDLNKPIVKEATIVQGCKTGHHTYHSDQTAIGSHNGVLEMRMKCLVCGEEIAKPIKMPGVEVPQETASQEGTIERVPAPAKPEPEPVGFGDLMEQARGEPFDPPWADRVRDRYTIDKTLDNFWENIKNNK